jgi:Fe-S-cluster-containing hydrogenase component 2
MYKIRVDHNKCTGCRHCETACSLNQLSTAINPKKSRIRVLQEGNRFFPIISGPFTDASCNIKTDMVIGDHVYDQCDLCRAVCPHKSVLFKNPDNEEPLQCDFCGVDAPGPSCVKWCASGALTLIEVPSYG